MEVAKYRCCKYYFTRCIHKRSNSISSDADRQHWPRLARIHTSSYHAPITSMSNSKRVGALKSNVYLPNHFHVWTWRKSTFKMQDLSVYILFKKNRPTLHAYSLSSYCSRRLNLHYKPIHSYIGSKLPWTSSQLQQNDTVVPDTFD